MKNFDATAHANQIRGNDGTGRFAVQRSQESVLALSEGAPDFTAHDRFEDKHGNLLRLVHFVDDKVTDGPGGAPAVVKFEQGGWRTEKHYTDGILHDGSGKHPSIARYRADGSLFSVERGYYEDTGHNKKFVSHDSPDGQPGAVKNWDGRRQVSRMQHGRRVSLDPAKPAYTVFKLDGSRQEDFHSSYGQRHNPNPDVPAVVGYHPNGTIAYNGFHESGLPANGPRGVHQEVFNEDGVLTATHEVHYDDAERYGYSRPGYYSNYYSAPRPVDEVLDSKLTEPEILDRIDENNQVVVRVKVPLAKQKTANYLHAAGIYQEGLEQVSATIAPIKRNRTIFDVVLDATELIRGWTNQDRYSDRISKPYWAARLAEKRNR